jgi:uncharacterized protein
MKKTLILAEIYRQNKHWSAPDEFFGELKNISYKRKLFSEILSFLPKRQIISIVGLRRVGKTILLKQIMKHLIKEADSKSIFFLTFDEAILPKGISIADYLNEYLEKIAPPKTPIYIFLDEIQYSKNWQHILKRYYDTETRIKFIVSGSSSLFLRKKTTESLAGRIYEFLLPTLSFEEYLELKELDKVLVENYALSAISLGEELEPSPERESFFHEYGSLMEQEFEKYIKFGQFPEIVNEKNIFVIRKYLIDAIYKKTVEYDIPKIFGVERVDELKFLFQVLANETGSMVETGNIAREVGIDEKTVKKYFHYFEESFLIFLVYNFSKSIRKSKRLLKKVYLGSPNFFSAFYDWPENGENNYKMGFLAENYCAAMLKRKYEFVSFYRVRKNEIDFLATNNLAYLSECHYIEVKYRESIPQKSLKFITKIVKKGGNRFTIVTKNDFRTEKDGAFVPIWMLK